MISTIILLTITYLALTSNLELSNIVVGVLLSALIGLLLPRVPYRWRYANLPLMLLALVRYVVQLIYDLIVSGIQVARIVLDPALPLKPGIIAIPSQSESPLSTALSAHAITLTPGEMVVEIDEKNVMYTHTLDAEEAETAVRNAQRLRSELLDAIVN